MSRVVPRLAAASVLLNRDQAGALGHAIGVEHAGEVVNLVGDESGDAALEHRDVVAAVNVLVLDLDTQRPGHLATNVKEAQAALVLLVLLVGLVDLSAGSTG